MVSFRHSMKGGHVDLILDLLYSGQKKTLILSGEMTVSTITQ